MIRDSGEGLRRTARMGELPSTTSAYDPCTGPLFPPDDGLETANKWSIAFTTTRLLVA